MRAVTFRVSSEKGWFGPFHRAVIESPEVSLQALHELRLLDDGSTVLLYEYIGDREAAERLADESLDSAMDSWQTGCIDGAEWMFAHTEPSGRVRGLLDLLGTYRIVVDWPITFPTDSVAVVTLIGADEELQRGFDNVPDDVSIRVERTGEYRSETERILTDLTDRERRTLAVAVELGYYRNPRQANYADIAAELECSTGTVGTHLRNVESKLMQKLVGGDSRSQLSASRVSP
jgi:DNA-binding CsgD family transcriptional regulator